MTFAFKARVNDPAVASFRYRVLTPISVLGGRGHAVELYDDTRFDRYEAVLFSKAYKAEDRELAERLRAAGKRVLLDLCDDHFYNPQNLPKYRKAREDLLAMIALCDQVVCSTPVLARAVQRHAKLTRAPAVAPDVYEQAKVAVGPPTPPGEPARLLWFGRHGSPNAPAGMEDLLLIREPLARAHALRPFEVVVCSDSEARHAELFADFPVPTRYVAWTPDSFAAELARCDAVLIPLSDNPFVAAKTHNRLSLALSAGAPVIADRLDSYEEFAPFCWIGDWEGGLRAVLLQPEQARARAAAARPYLEARWSAEAVAPLWEAALGLEPGAPVRRELALTAEPPPPPFSWWLRQSGRSAHPWLIAGREAPLSLVREAQAQGFLVMTVGEEIRRYAAEVAYVPDLETVHAHGEGIFKRAKFLLMPQVPHLGGWAGGRTLESWSADVPVLKRLRREGRLLGFALWTGSADGVFGALDGCEVPLRLLERAGVQTVRQLGFEPPAPPAEGPTSILQRRAGALCPAFEA